MIDRNRVDLLALIALRARSIDSLQQMQARAMRSPLGFGPASPGWSHVTADSDSTLGPISGGTRAPAPLAAWVPQAARPARRAHSPCEGTALTVLLVSVFFLSSSLSLSLFPSCLSPLWLASFLLPFDLCFIILRSQQTQRSTSPPPLSFLSSFKRQTLGLIFSLFSLLWRAPPPPPISPSCATPGKDLVHASSYIHKNNLWSQHRKITIPH